MGNRGVLHDDEKRIVAQWRGKRWITCLLNFRGRKREVFTPGRYSELFFLDEATAYAAGHRPCAECRREDFNRFRAAWVEHEERAWLVLAGKVLPWTFEGYGAAVPVTESRRVRVLTPPSIVRLFASGLVPQVHASAHN